MEILKFTLGPVSTHCYLVREGDFCAVIDAEKNDGEIAAELERRGWRLTDVLLTHAHFDHVRGVPELARDGARIHIHEGDASFLSGQNRDIGFPFLKREEITGPINILKDGDRIGPFRVLHAPGHSPGSALFVAEGHVFSGDAMFVGGAPRLDFSYCDPLAYERSLEALRTLPPDDRLHAGHGSEGLVREGLPL